MKLLIKLRFCGTNYCGFQAQPDGNAIQNVLTETFSSLFGFPCAVTGCSRTDSGVHALGFCATVEPRDTADRSAWCPIPIGRVHRAANVRLPNDISVVASAAVPDDFHPRYNVFSKEYEYRIYDTPARDPFMHQRAYHAVKPLSDESIRIMNDVASVFCGEHDFSAFMATGSKITDSVRTVYNASVCREAGGTIVYRVEANGFLYNMVRIMVGTLLECAQGSRTIEDVKEAIATGDRRLAGFTAPADGLYLKNVTFDREINWLCE